MTTPSAGHRRHPMHLRSQDNPIGLACITHNVDTLEIDFPIYFEKDLALVFFLQQCGKASQNFQTDFVIPLNKACDGAWHSIWGVRGIRPFEHSSYEGKLDATIVYATNIFEEVIEENNRTHACHALPYTSQDLNNLGPRLAWRVLKVRNEPTFDIPFSELWVISYHGKKERETRMSTQLEKLLEVVFEGVKKHGIPALIGADFNTKVEIIEKCLKKVGTSRDDWKEMPRTTYFGPPNHNNNTIDGFIFIQPRENEIEGETEVLEGMCERRNDKHQPIQLRLSKRARNSRDGAESSRDRDSAPQNSRQNEDIPATQEQEEGISTQENEQGRGNEGDEQVPTPNQDLNPNQNETVQAGGLPNSNAVGGSEMPSNSTPINSTHYPQHQNEAGPPRRGVGSTDQALILATQVIQASRLIPNEVKKKLQDFIREEHNPVWGTYINKSRRDEKTACLISWLAFSYLKRESPWTLNDRMMLYGAGKRPSFALFFPDDSKVEFTPRNSGGPSDKDGYVNKKNHEYNKGLYMRQTDGKDKDQGNGGYLFKALTNEPAGQEIDMYIWSESENQVKTENQNFVPGKRFVLFVHHSETNKEEEKKELERMGLQHIGSIDKQQKDFPGGWSTIQKFCSEEEVKKLRPGSTARTDPGHNVNETDDNGGDTDSAAGNINGASRPATAASLQAANRDDGPVDGHYTTDQVPDEEAHRGRGDGEVEQVLDPNPNRYEAGPSKNRMDNRDPASMPAQDLQTDSQNLTEQDRNDIISINSDTHGQDGAESDHNLRQEANTPEHPPSLMSSEVKKKLQDFIGEEHDLVWGTHGEKRACLISWFAFSYSTRKSLQDKMLLYRDGGRNYMEAPGFILFFPQNAGFKPDSIGTSVKSRTENKSYNLTAYMKQTDCDRGDIGNGGYLYKALEIGQAGQTIDMYIWKSKNFMPGKRFVIFVHHSENNKKEEENELERMGLQHIFCLEKPMRRFPGAWSTIKKFCSVKEVTELQSDLTAPGHHVNGTGDNGGNTDNNNDNNEIEPNDGPTNGD